MTNATPTLQAADFAGRTLWEHGGLDNLPRDRKTYTVASRHGRTDVADDREIGRKADGSLGWAVSVNDVFHFERREDAETVAQAFGPHRAGAVAHVMPW